MVQTNNKDVYIFCDGGSRRKNGNIGAFATIMKLGDLEGADNKVVISKLFSDVTNNQMELAGALQGLAMLVDVAEPKKITLSSDSEYLIKGINVYSHTWKENGYKTYAGKPIANLEVWKVLFDLIDYLTVTKGCELEAIWVKGHTKLTESSTYAEIYNVECDDTLNITMDSYTREGKVPLDYQAFINTITRLTTGEYNSIVDSYSAAPIFKHEFLDQIRQMAEKDYYNLLMAIFSYELGTTEEDVLLEVTDRFMNSSEGSFLSQEILDFRKEATFEFRKEIGRNE